MKLSRLFVLGVLIAALGGASAWSQDRAAAKRFSLSMGGTYVASRLGYSYTFVPPDWSGGEAMTLTDVLLGKRLPGYSLGFGYFVGTRFEVFGGVYSAGSRGYSSEVAVSLPNDNFPGDIARDSVARKRTASHLDLLLGGRYHFGPIGPLGLYLGAGGCYAFSTFDLVSNAIFADHYDDYGFHEVAITFVYIQKTTAQAMGGFVMGGLEVALPRSLSIYAESVYKFAKNPVVHPMSDVSDPIRVGGDMGGFIGSLGLRFRF